MKEKGITLIALVVTIVVLLILAGVSISMLTGENGIITRAEESSIKNDNGAVLEGIKLKLADYYAQYKGELQEDKINLLKADGIIDNNCIVNVPKLLGKKLSTGNGSGRKDVYLIENNHLYYLDKNEEAYDIDFNQEAEDAGMKYIEYIKNILVNAENSWLRVEYAVYNNGGAEKAIEELEQMFVEKNGGTGNFDNFLVQEGMSREDFNNMIKEQGFRTEEDFLKVFIYLQ